ncbi:uncharacterized protein LOC117169743 [Belonocnema kinseyi]|uniref:uncharacterized protein LOC117169743 n=1 Tax=Belonocnema kinseyi TaxID=2817044 RepID=UPI00143CE079|nr:uncharacterized protein LOC117169743 [Belonocnema kinseyi]
MPLQSCQNIKSRALYWNNSITIYYTQYWIIGARNEIKPIIKTCVVLVRDNAKTETQLMGNIPTPRVTPSRSFSHVGIDYAGPFSIRSSSGRGIKSHKACIAVIVCFAVKVIHLELAHDYLTASFIAALNRFTSRRGLPTDIYSDNATNFRGSDRELSRAFRKLQNDSNLASLFAADSTTWDFVPPIAPHFGGLWETGVKRLNYIYEKYCQSLRLLLTSSKLFYVK